jgi:hypothetical protein
LTGYWPLDEGTGTTALDASGNDLNGAWSGTMASASGTYYTAGLVGPSAGYFDGSDDYIEMSSSTLFNSQAVTMSAWIYPTADSIQSTIMGKEEQYKLVVKDGQLGILSTCDGLEWNTNQYVSSSVPLDAWTYATFVMDGPDGVISMMCGFTTARLPRPKYRAFIILSNPPIVAFQPIFWGRNILPPVLFFG